MELYLNYVDYKAMGGRLPIGVYTDLAVEAQSEIDWHTFGRLKKFDTIPEEISRCMYRLIQVLTDKLAVSGNVNAAGVAGVNPQIASQSNDGVSISYNVMSASDVVASARNEVDSTISKYLADVRDSYGRRILYRGLYADE